MAYDLTAKNDGHIGMTEGEFSVCQWFDNGDYEYTRRAVAAEEAMKAFAHYTHSVAARLGMTRKVIITDGGDCINAEWRYGEGVVYPPKGS